MINQRVIILCEAVLQSKKINKGIGKDHWKLVIVVLYILYKD